MDQCIHNTFYLILETEALVLFAAEIVLTISEPSQQAAGWEDYRKVPVLAVVVCVVVAVVAVTGMVFLRPGQRLGKHLLRMYYRLLKVW